MDMNNDSKMKSTFKDNLGSEIMPSNAPASAGNIAPKARREGSRRFPGFHRSPTPRPLAIRPIPTGTGAVFTNAEYDGCFSLPSPSGRTSATVPPRESGKGDGPPGKPPGAESISGIGSMPSNRCEGPGGGGSFPPGPLRQAGGRPEHFLPRDGETGWGKATRNLITTHFQSVPPTNDR